MNKRYQELKEEARSLSQKNFCGPLALAVGCNVKLQTAIDLLEQLGRSNKRVGTYNYVFETAFERLGYKLRLVERADLELLEPDMALSTRSVERNVEAWRGKSYFAMMEGHVATIIDGEIIDWTAGLRKRIFKLYEITPAG